MATLPLTEDAYAEIKKKLLAAGYAHSIGIDGHGVEFIDMNGLCVQPSSGPVVTDVKSLFSQDNDPYGAKAEEAAEHPHETLEEIDGTPAQTQKPDGYAEAEGLSVLGGD